MAVGVQPGLEATGAAARQVDARIPRAVVEIDGVGVCIHCIATLVSRGSCNYWMDLNTKRRDSLTPVRLLDL